MFYRHTLEMFRIFEWFRTLASFECSDSNTFRKRSFSEYLTRKTFEKWHILGIRIGMKIIRIRVGHSSTSIARTSSSTNKITTVLIRIIQICGALRIAVIRTIQLFSLWRKESMIQKNLDYRLYVTTVSALQNGTAHLRPFAIVRLSVATDWTRFCSSSTFCLAVYKFCFLR